MKEGFRSKIVYLSVAAVLCLVPAMAMAQFSVDFRNSTGYGVTNADQVQIDGIRVDLSATHPLTGEPMIVSVDGNIRWQFDYDSMTLRIIGAEDSNNTGCTVPSFIVQVTDARSGAPVAGATVAIQGTSVVTDANGDAVFENLTRSNVLIQVTAENYGSVEQSEELFCGESNSTGVSLVSTLDPGTLRGDILIVLTWGENPRDLDSHLTRYASRADTERHFHVYYGDTNNCSGAACDTAVPAWLDVDDVTSFGPETITIPRSAAGFEPGIYRYSVHHYSGTSNIPGSGAVVQIYEGGVLERTYRPPANADAGDDWVWTVVEIEVFADGQVSYNEVGQYYGPTGSGSVASAPASVLGIPVQVENPALFENLPAK